MSVAYLYVLLLTFNLSNSQPPQEREVDISEFNIPEQVLQLSAYRLRI